VTRYPGTPGFLRLESRLGNSPRSSINPKTQLQKRFRERELKALFVMMIVE